jgi:hypothetical protein
MPRLRLGYSSSEIGEHLNLDAGTVASTFGVGARRPGAGVPVGGELAQAGRVGWPLSGRRYQSVLIGTPMMLRRRASPLSA